MATQVVALSEQRFLEDDSNTSDVATSTDETNTDQGENIDFMKWYKIIILTVGVVAVFLVLYALGWLCKICYVTADKNEELSKK